MRGRGGASPPRFCVRPVSAGDHIDGPQTAVAAGIGLGIEGDLLAFFQLTIAAGLDGGEVDEHVLAAVVVGDKAEALLRVEPLYSTLIHIGYLLQKTCFVRQKKTCPPISYKQSRNTSIISYSKTASSLYTRPEYKYNQNADQHNLNPAACFGFAIIKEP